VRYSHSRLGGRSMSPVVKAAATAASAAINPSQRCHSRAGDASTIPDEVRSHPAPADATANAAPARTFATATVRHAENRVVTETSSAIVAIRIKAIGKCTSRGCNRPVSAIQVYGPGGGQMYSRTMELRFRNKCGGSESSEQTMPHRDPYPEPTSRPLMFLRTLAATRGYYLALR
jgi:hypothetical protein